MTHWLSDPIEKLLRDLEPGSEVGSCDVLVVGSGYGGAITALRLAGASYKDEKKQVRPLDVIVLERGKEYALGDFPESLGELPGHVRFRSGGGELPTGYAHGLFDVRIGDPVSILVGNGLGGTSLINANVALEPEEAVFADPAWPTQLRDKKALAESFEKVRRLLGVKEADVAGSKKFAALELIAKALGKKCVPAPIAVTQSTGENALGVMQQKCIKCSNCVTGCNYGAKNTLAMNVLPLARERGAGIYTGANVLSVEPDGASRNGSTGWRVRFQRTATIKGDLAAEIFTIAAGAVVLAAGTLGSTEILLRSQRAGKLLLSDRLGSRFSTNGDAIACGYAQKTEVNAVAHADFASKPGPVDQREIGPTITGYFSADASPEEDPDSKYRVVIEDASVPSALAIVLGEVAATAALPKRLLSAGLGPLRPAWFETDPNTNKDPLAVQPGALRHSQLLLAMGNDRAPGALCLRYPAGKPDSHDRAAVEVVWSPATGDACTHDPSLWESQAPRSVFAAIDSLLATAEKKGNGFDGGDYLANPLWRALPAELKDLTSATLPGYKLVAVHPLGGCPMGDDRVQGVVDHAGSVFDAGAGSANGVYHGLHVLDGSIVPSAVATNPFLTISALAYRSAGLMLKANDWIESSQDRVTQAALKAPPVSRKTVPLDAHQVAARFSEQLMGSLDRVPRWLRKCLEDDNQQNHPMIALLAEERGFVARIEIEIADMHGFLRDTRKPLPAHCRVYANAALTDTVPPEHLQGALLAEGPGSVELMAWDRPNWAEEAWRVLQALIAFADRRGVRDLAEQLDSAPDSSLQEQGRLAVERLARAGLNEGALGAIAQGIDGLRSGNPELVKRLAKQLEKMIAKDGDDFDLGALADLFGPLVSMARHHAQWRKLCYSFNLTGANGAFSLDGTKELAYAPGKPNPWTALIELPIELRDLQGRGSVDGKLCVDLIDLTEHPALQVTASPDTPVSLAAVASFGMLSLRALFQTHLWTFRTPEYRPSTRGVDPSTQPHLVLADGRVIFPDETQKLNVPPPALDPIREDIYLRLMRYCPPNPHRGSILLVHGLAHGSSLFTTDTIAVSFASHLYENGYDVWLLDHRLSNELPDCRKGSATRWLAELQTTIDEVAEHDIATAVHHVYEKTGAPIQVFAHCVGAAATSMAVLSGRCHDTAYGSGKRGKRGGRSKIAALGIHAVPPWLVASMPNRLRANLAALVKDAIRQKVVDPIPSRTPGAAEKLLDSLCSSIPWPSSVDVHRHDTDTDPVNLGREICGRYNVFYGLEWNHKNLAPETHKQLHRLVGVGNIETFRQIFFMTLRQRITTRDGRNDYLLTPKLVQYWTFPTLFAHGSDNGVFSPLSSVRSFIRLSLIRCDERKHKQKQKPHIPADVFLFESPAVGHLDFLFGKDARYKIYPYLDGFFRMAKALPGVPVDIEKAVVDELNRQRKTLPLERDPHWRAPPIPECGPAIGWTRTVAGRISLRLWMEALDDTTSPPRQLAIGGRTPPPATRIDLPAGPEYPGSYFIYDISVAPGTSHLNLGIDYDEGIWRRFPQKDRASRSLPLDVQLKGLPWFDRLSGDARADGVAFLVGSCRYPGSPFERELSDRIFQAMLPHVQGKNDGTRPGVDHLLLVGDQIYADATADLFDTREPRERFSGRYREMLQSKNASALLTKLPCAMAIDDHEIADNWPGLDNAASPPELVAAALAAAKAYEWGSSSRAGNVDGRGLWHHFVSGAVPFFVLDTRTQRRLRRAGQLGSAKLIERAQQDALTHWLDANACKKMPLFIVSGSPIAPITRDEQDASLCLRGESEGWIGYPQTLSAVMRHIAEKQIEQVVFVGGDPHFSASAQIRIEAGNKSVQAYQIVTSGLFAPLPFANARECDFQWNGPVQIDLDGVSMWATSTLLTAARQQFMRVDVERSKNGWKTLLQVYGANGNEIARKALF